MIKTSSRKRILTIAALAAMLVMASAITAFAVEGYAMPQLDEDASLNITVEYHDVDENNTPIDTPISGITLSAYKVANLKVNNEGSALYRITTDFSATDVKFDWGYDDASAHIAAATTLSEHLAATNPKPAPIGTIVTDNDGKADFGKVEPGIYLIIQDNATGMALDYTTLRPFLISAPEPKLDLDENGVLIDESKNEWVYNIVAAPKAELIKYETPPPPDEPPTDDTPPPPNDPPPTEDDTPERRVINTGDATRIAIWAVLMAAAIVAIVVIKRKNKKQ